MKNDDARQAEIDELKSAVAALEKRLAEDETVIASLQAWTLYSFGTVLRHASAPHEKPTDWASSQIEGALERMYDNLKQGYRGTEELHRSTDGFDRLYICAQEIASRWKTMYEHRFAQEPDLRGTKLIEVGYDTMQRLEPMGQKMAPLETRFERQLRQEANALVHLIQTRPAE